ncbi:MAG: VPA1262 family N-terminal domain-containing protein [Agitococcus sp.]|nr:VPA1262 family N-terminal domain-containing protein [Agitococcus sp.]
MSKKIENTYAHNNKHLEDLLQMLKEGVIGFYNQIEVITVFGIKKGQSEPFNVFTLLVAEERKSIDLIQEKLLTSKLIDIKGIKDVKFGVVNYSIHTQDLEGLISTAINSKQWKGLGKTLVLSNDISFNARVFVPANSFKEIPLNNVLKNNFYNGSYVFEVFDISKGLLSFLLDKPSLLQDLSEKIRDVIPIKIGSLSDRLGNIVIQLPIQIVMADISHTRQDNNIKIDIVWHPKALPRDLRVTCVREDDFSYQDFFSAVMDKQATSLLIPMNHEMYSHRYYLWDDECKLLLGASIDSSFVRNIHMNGAIIEHEPRVFYFDDDVNFKNEQRITVVNNQDWSAVGDNKICDQVDLLKRKRLYGSERLDLKLRKHFIQYRNNSVQAYIDIRWLISRYGQKEVCLWDPYLSAGDILKTLFFCEHYGARQRAITGLKEGGSSIKKYEQKLDYFGGNKFGLNIEFRARHGQKGWPFHDRFLIFPKTDQGSLVWSLGTSVNSLGQDHHVFQKVSDGQMIVDTFEELWSELSDEEYLVWKS